MEKSIGAILNRCFPVKMTWCETAKMSIAARVRSFMFWGWRWPVPMLAHHAMDTPSFTLKMKLSISVVSCGIGPN